MEKSFSTRRFALVICVSVVAAGLVACAAGDAPHASGEVVVRDSAGIRIVENSWALDEAPAVWRVSDEPVLEIGVLDGPEAYQLHQVTGALRLNDGSIVVANGGTSEVRYFDSTSRFLSAAGRRGEGPGEFAAIFGLIRYRADSLLVWDGRLGRVSVLAPAGEFARSFAAGSPGFRAAVFGFDVDGTVLFTDTRYEAPLEGLREQSVIFVRYAPDGALIDSLPRYPTFTTLPIDLGDGHVMTSSRMFDATTVAAATSDHYYVGTARTGSIDVRNPAGELLAQIRWNHATQPVTRAHIEAYRDEAMTRSATPDRATENFLRAMVYAEELPAHDQLRVDAASRLWVQWFRPAYESGPDRWTVFDDNGRMVGRVAIPEGFRLFDMGENYVLGVERDTFGVEYVRKYSLHRTDGV